MRWQRARVIRPHRLRVRRRQRGFCLFASDSFGSCGMRWCIHTGDHHSKLRIFQPTSNMALQGEGEEGAARAANGAEDGAAAADGQRICRIALTSAAFIVIIRRTREHRSTATTLPFPSLLPSSSLSLRALQRRGRSSA